MTAGDRHSLPRVRWLPLTGEVASPRVLLQRKLVFEAESGVRCTVTPTLPVPVPVWADGEARGFGADVDPSVLATPTSWLPKAARTSANPVAVASWLEATGWYDAEDSSWASPLTEASRHGVTEAEARRWLRGEPHAVLDAIWRALPEFSETDAEVTGPMGRRWTAATVEACKMLVEDVDAYVPGVVDPSLVQSSVLAAGLLDLPDWIATPSDFEPAMPLRVFIPAIGVAVTEHTVEPAEAATVLRQCLLHAQDAVTIGPP